MRIYGGMSYKGRPYAGVGMSYRMGGRRGGNGLAVGNLERNRLVNGVAMPAALISGLLGGLNAALLTYVLAAAGLLALAAIFRRL